MTYLFARNTKSNAQARIATVALLALLGSAVAPLQAANATAGDFVFSFTVACETGLPPVDDPYDGPTYLVTVYENPESLEVDDGASCDGNVVIQEGVTSILDNAFEESSLTSINIAGTVTTIGNEAFKNARNLASVTFAEESELETIGSYAFYVADDESSLESITIPSRVSEIGVGAFERTVQLSSVTFEGDSQLLEIPSFAFTSARSLTAITIPSSVTSIGIQAFNGATELVTVTFEEGSALEYIGANAFQSAIKLESITIPNNVTAIEYSAFAGTSSLTTVIFSPNSSLESIGQDAFYGAESLASIAIPSSVTSIGMGAFEEARALNAVTFEPDSALEFIGANAFLLAESLTSISIPTGVTEINSGTFLGAESLVSISLPSSLTSIGADAFANTRALTSIVIPASVTSIGNGAFWGANKLESFYFLGNAPDPASIGNAFCVEDNINITPTPPEGNDYCGAPLAKAFIQSNATGFQPGDPVPAGYGDGKTEIYWKGLIVRPAPAYIPSAVYRSWGAPLTSITNGPKVGESVYASAFERELSRLLYLDQDDYSFPPKNFRSAVNEEGKHIYPVEEYVYRITKLPNTPTSSVDRQSAAGYESLTATEQEDWYTEMGFNGVTDYEFSWRAFMCVFDSTGAVDAVPPSNISLSYASREDGPLGDEENANSFMFRDTSGDLLLGRSLSTRTVVGTSFNFVAGGGLVGGPDVSSNAAFALGVSQVNSSCGVGKTLHALRIVDKDTDARFASKEFQVQDKLRLELPQGGYFDVVDPSGVTIGVTGVASVWFNAALWGLTTIASANPPSGGGGSSGGNAAPVVSPNAPSVQPISKSRSTIISGFLGDSSKAPSSLRQRINRMFSGFKNVARAECTGYTSGRTPSRWDTLLANRRAKVACDLVKQRYPSAKVKVIEKPAVGVGSKFRSVRIKIVGF
jgi:flagellar basal body rod protein FlgG